MTPRSESPVASRAVPSVPERTGEAGRMAVHYSAARDDWGTPAHVFAPLDAEFGFTLDPCASVRTAKCARFFTADDDGLVRAWDGERVFMNPPYGRAIVRWMAKAHRESARHGALVVALVPARTDTAWWHDHVIAAGAEIRFIRGRIKFERDGAAAWNAPFPCALVIYRPALTVMRCVA